MVLYYHFPFLVILVHTCQALKIGIMAYLNFKAYIYFKSIFSWLSSVSITTIVLYCVLMLYSYKHSTCSLNCLKLNTKSEEKLVVK